MDMGWEIKRNTEALKNKETTDVTEVITAYRKRRECHADKNGQEHVTGDILGCGLNMLVRSKRVIKKTVEKILRHRDLWRLIYGDKMLT
jgi:hypothetical protein